MVITSNKTEPVTWLKQNNSSIFLSNCIFDSQFSEFDKKIFEREEFGGKPHKLLAQTTIEY